jgi:serine/threonine protein kinase
MMNIAEVQRHFTAYESGEIPESELRNCLRKALAQEPELSSAFIALIEAYRRAKVIDPGLQSALNADIAEVTGPRMGATMIRPRPERDTGWFVADPHPTDLPLPPMYASPDAAPRRLDVQNSDELGTNDHSQPSYRGETSARIEAHPSGTPFSNTGGRSANTGSTGGSSWETEDRLTEVAAPLYPGSVLRERFVLVEELGRGGMGVVYKAFDRSRGDAKERYVALKILNEEFKRHPLAVRALQREARKAQKLAHPNIATVYDFDRDGGNVYMVMELLFGRSLDQVLREDGCNGIPIVPALGIVKSLAAALSYAHEQGIVHSDFKPSNAFLTRDGKVKVLDFGIARAAPNMLETVEKTTFDAGQLDAISPAYASLEMLRGQEPDVRDDVYALACVTYELLTGTHPYRRIDALKAHESGLEPRVIRKLSRPQWRALRQGLAFERADRCPTVGAFAGQLLQPPRRAKRWITAGAVAAALAGLVAAGAWQLNVQRYALLQGLSDPDSTKSAAAVTKLQAMPGFLRDQLLDTPTQTALIGEFQKEMEAAVALGRYDYPDAARLLNTLKSLLPHSDRVPQLERDFNGRLQAELARQIQLLDRALASSTVFASQGEPNVTDVLQRIRRLDPNNAALREPAVPAAYANAADSAFHDGRAELARQIVLAGLGATPDDAPLLALQRQIGGPGVVAAGPLPSEPSGSDSQHGEVSAELAMPDPAEQAANPHAGDATRTKVEILREELETKAAAGDTKGASAAASALTRAEPGSGYVTRDVPHILMSSWVHLAKAEFAAGHLDDALKTLAEGRRHFGKSVELIDLERRYVAAGDIYDRLSSAVTLNVADMQQSLEALRMQAGDEYEVAAQMLAQTLADRIADERVADRGPVADRLLQSGQRLFPNYTALLGRGTAGVLANTPISVDDKVANERVTSDRSGGEKATGDKTGNENTENTTSDQTASDGAHTGIPLADQAGSNKAVSERVSTEKGVDAEAVSDEGDTTNNKTAARKAGSEKSAEAKPTENQPERQ